MIIKRIHLFFEFKYDIQVENTNFKLIKDGREIPKKWGGFTALPLSVVVFFSLHSLLV